KVNYNVELPAGEHILRLTVTGAWFDIDYINFVKGADAIDPEKGNDPPNGIAQNLNMNTGRVSDYDVFTMQGQNVGRVSAYSISDAISYVKNGNKPLAKGAYFLLDRSTGKMQVFKVAK
ncbi:MAG: carbohydrate-binding protein, partial [Fibrobacter sp.]|nr:carbohydrate-binding protein [Fibrobacter sp.]